MWEALAAMLPTAGSAVGDLAGVALQDHYNRAASAKQMEFQERMRNTAYQAAAADLEKAGLNRIVALGNPATSPSGASLPVSAPQVGSTITNARVANANIEVAKQNAGLLADQRALTQTNTAKAAAEADFIKQQTLQSVSQTALNHVLAAWQEDKRSVIPHEIKELISRSGLQGSQAKYYPELSRLTSADADQAQVLKRVYSLLNPLLDELLKSWAPMARSASRSIFDFRLSDHLPDFGGPNPRSRSGGGSSSGGSTHSRPMPKR